jgi:hypothetical protein
MPSIEPQYNRITVLLIFRLKSPIKQTIAISCIRQLSKYVLIFLSVLHITLEVRLSSFCMLWLCSCRTRVTLCEYSCKT